MAGTGRVVLGVVVGMVIWSVLWLGGSSVAQSSLPELIPAGERVEHVGVLLGYLAWSVVLSVLAGYATAAIAGMSAMRAVWVLAVIQLGLGIFFETSAWEITPVWYHVVFLVLLVPATVAGGRLRAGRSTA
jgi:hypothetical protein